jgi:hypothetical protein
MDARDRMNELRCAEVPSIRKGFGNLFACLLAAGAVHQFTITSSGIDRYHLITITQDH